MTDKFMQEFNDYNKLMRRLGSKQMTLFQYQKYRSGKMRVPRNGKSKPAMYAETYRRESPKIPSGDGIAYTPSKTDRNEYTGTLIKGIGTMHKSNSVPVTNDEDILAIARMRR
jgi:hypothetical protein